MRTKNVLTALAALITIFGAAGVAATNETQYTAILMLGIIGTITLNMDEK